VGAITFALLCLLHARVWGMLGDSYMSVTAGRLIDAHGLPHVDTLTVEGRGRSWVDQQWLAHWLFFRSWVAGGFATVALLSAGLVASAFGFLAAMLARVAEQGEVPGRRIVWVVSMAFACCALFAFTRAQCFAFPLFVALVWVLERDARAARPGWRLALAPLLLIVWANVHGTVLVGVALTIVAAACGVATTLWSPATFHSARGRASAVGTYAAISVAAALTPLATPYGTGIVHYYQSVLDNPGIREHVGEWAAPSPNGLSGVVYALLVALSVAAVVQGVRRGLLASPFLLAGTTLLVAAAAMSIRNDSWLAIMTALLFADSTARRASRRSRFAHPHLIGGGVLTAMLIGIGFLYTNPVSDWNRIASPRVLAMIVRELHTHPNETVLADGGTSSTLLWIHPELAGRVAFDSRLELFPQRRLRMFYAFTDGDLGPRSELRRRYDVVAITGSPQKGRLAHRLEREGGATRLFAGTSGVVLRERRSSRSHATAGRVEPPLPLELLARRFRRRLLRH
jgi:hypothetical protein